MTQASADSHRSRRSFSASLVDIGSTLSQIVRTRFSLLAVEIAEEKARLPLLLGLALGAMICLALGAAVLSGWVLLFFWDTHRLEAFAFLGLGYVLVGIGLVCWLRYAVAHHPIPFETTINELEKDAAWLQSLSHSLDEENA